MEIPSNPSKKERPNEHCNKRGFGPFFVFLTDNLSLSPPEMKKFTLLLLWLILTFGTKAQSSYPVSFNHDGKSVYGTFITPIGTGPFPTIIIAPGSGANDRDGTLPMQGANVSCLYPDLLNDTLRFYKELAENLADSGYAVLRYDKLEYTYPNNLGIITFHKLWLPVESAIRYVKTRNDVDTNNIVLLGHSEGSSLIPFIAKKRNDVKALISVAGPRTPFDSLLAHQIIGITQTCGGNMAQAQTQANQILSYFHSIRTNSWNGATPALFGVPASAWYNYVRATDSVAINYNLNQLPTLFIGMALDINVPPSELVRFQQEVTITNAFWSMPGLIHYLTPDNNPHVSTALTDTIVHWLKQNNIETEISQVSTAIKAINVIPNPFQETFTVSTNFAFENLTLSIYNPLGQVLMRKHETALIPNSDIHCTLKNMPQGIYFLELISGNQKFTRKIVKH